MTRRLDDPIASTALHFRRPDGGRGEVSIAIGRPVEAEPGIQFDCPIALSLRPDTRSVAGADSFQALCLALAYVRITLEGFREDGWEFLAHADDAEPFPFKRVWFSTDD